MTDTENGANEMTRTFRYEDIEIVDLTATDLRTEAKGASAFAGAYRIHIDGQAEAAQALVVPDAADPSEGRIGIAWGAHASWGDVHHIWAPDDGTCDGKHDIEQAIRDWLDDEGAWARRA